MPSDDPPGPAESAARKTIEDVAYIDSGHGDPVVLLHGGSRGGAVYVGAADLWKPLTTLLSTSYRCIAIDLPGCGQSAWRPADASPENVADSVARCIAGLGVDRLHLVAHGDAALIALRVAREHHNRRFDVRSCSLIAAHQAAPDSDGLDNIATANVPVLESARARLAWALDRLSYSPAHITSSLLDILGSHADSDGYQAAERHFSASSAGDELQAALAREKAAVFEFSREDSYGFPLGLVWGADDPSTSVAHGFELMKVLSRNERKTTFSVMNRTGHFAYRENPAELTRFLLPIIEIRR